MEDLKLQRRQIKASLTRAVTYLDKSDPNDIIDDDRYEKFIELLESFNDVQDQIERLDEKEFDTTEREDFENKYYSNKLRYTLRLATVQNNDSAASNGNSAVNSFIKLPTIELPTFSGNYDDWLSFYDIFNSLIHNNDNIPNVQKFHYLKSTLKGEAANVLHSLEISSDNYVNAWQMLQDRYSNTRIIVQKHINGIFNLPTAHKENVNILRQILDGFTKHFRALTALNRPTKHWDDLLICIVSKKLDVQSLKEWEAKIQSTELPTLKEFTSFLTQKCQTLEAISKASNSNYKISTNVSTNRSSLMCTFCKGSHAIYQCRKFLNLPVDKRIEEVKAKKLCLKCLKGNHTFSKCLARSCKHCHKKHNDLLHLQPISNSERPQVEASTSVSNHSSNINTNNHILLSTAMVDIIDQNGKIHTCRVLLDSGSQSHLLTYRMAKILKLPLTSTHISLSGVTQFSTRITQTTKVSIQSRNTNFKTKLDCLVLDKISERLPLTSISRDGIEIPKNIRLADPDFNISRDVDMLIGAELFYKLQCIGQIKIGERGPYLQKTLLGWVIAGKIIAPQVSANATTCNSVTLKQLNDNLNKFWEVENVNKNQLYSQEEKLCEQHFANNTKRNIDGRFCVSLPFKRNISSLGTSREQALKRFYSLERKLSKNDSLRQDYSVFIKEYQDLGHMRPTNILKDAAKNHFYLPHHAVIKENSLTTRLRVVFDASAKSSTGTSLNDTLMVGPKLQQDLFDIVCRFRMYRYALTADIAKMYRQVAINEDCMPFQRILWRNTEKDDIQTFELTTVTYGTASASYLAIKVLQQLATEALETHTVGAERILRDFYVDDLLTGTNDPNEARQIIHEIIDILAKGKFELRKWASNQPDLLRDIPETCSGSAILDLNKSDGLNTLGLQWKVNTDNLQYSLSTFKSKNITKRHILSHVSKIFDPLGLISPCNIKAKILMQDIWKLKLNWDESLPLNIQNTWISYLQEMEHLAEITIPRKAVSVEKPAYLELHGFCDASEKAYGACVYIRAVNKKGSISSRLLCSKSKVAPIKTITLPRLELCGAVLLAQLIQKLMSILHVQFSRILYWTDSTIVISWLKSHRAFKTFVANRVGEIQDTSEISNWHHISSSQNPADLISRGVPLKILKNAKLWWNGPAFLEEEASEWPNAELPAIEALPEVKNIVTVNIIADNCDLFTKYSSLNKLTRVVAYCLRFTNNAKAKCSNSTMKINTGYLECSELERATIILIKLVQKHSFAREYNDLQARGRVNSKSSLLCLNPFLDNEGIVRVGGRLKRASIPYSQKHQILLPAKHPFTTLVIQTEHIRQLHAGIQQTIASVRAKYWPLSIKNSVKSIIRKCITCFRAKPSNIDYLMGDLPTDRVTSTRAFQNVGVDYFGPLYIRDGSRRKYNLTKAYGAVFVCFATKAVHLELVGNLTTDAFIAALKRFISRRGNIFNIYSDNGTQFVGTNSELKKLVKQLNSQYNQEELQAYFSHNQIKWHFIPPRSPHFGGLWEAAVKSVKMHLTRIIGKSSLNYEEMITLLVQIEAVLNSRPITAISNDPNDLTFLTPFQFLTGTTHASIPEPSLVDVKVNSLSRWQYVQQIREHFWKRWHGEYLHQLQRRNKWNTSTKQQLRPGLLVIIREDNTPPCQWILGRILETHPGRDGIVRTATIKTSNGTVQRPSVKLCVLPVYDD